MPLEKQYVSRGGFGYGKASITDRGQIVTLEGLRGDEALVRLGHLRELPKGARPLACGKCGAQFVADGDLFNHGELRHVPRSAEEQDRLEEKALKMSDAIAPLRRDRSKASLGEGARA